METSSKHNLPSLRHRENKDGGHIFLVQLMKATFIGFFSVALLIQQVPGRKMFLTALWQSKTCTHSASGFTSADTRELKSVPPNFRRCRPCVVQSKNSDAPVEQVFAAYFPDQTSSVAAFSFLNRQSSYKPETFHCKPKRSPPISL
jgi:hypothetical protein